MHKIVIFGNSGSGKSTLAQAKAHALGCAHLDLDTVAWAPGHDTPTRHLLADSEKLIAPFLAAHEDWVIEGCYADLMALVAPQSTEMIFLNPGTATCVENCKRRPWEPHKYASMAAQNENLAMLMAWIEQYVSRTDACSLQAHRQLFDAYQGQKREYHSNERDV